MRKIRIFAVFAVITLGLVSCAKERTLEDWRRDRVSEQLAQIQARSGTYSGATQLSTGEILGFELQVEPDTEISLTRDSISTAPQAALQGRVRIWLDRSVYSLRFRGGFIDPNTGGFKAEIPVTLRNGTIAELALSGTLDAGRATGRLGAAIYPELSSSFEAKLNSVPVNSEKLKEEIPARLEYTGSLLFTDGSTSDAIFRMIHSPATTDQEIYDLFDEVRWTHVELWIDGVSYLFPAQWRTQEKRLVGIFSQGQGSAGGATSGFAGRLECFEKEGGAVRVGWECDYSSVSAASSVGFKSSLKRK
ncbi:MAG: hypothetical protein JNL01_09700 [Bdellovibrionales bacterium]|nr:hypothetical protein [Bdellovibrionales bacterium]